MKVICDQAKSCKRFDCGGKTPHEYDAEECDCAIVEGAECVPVEK